ncbi:MAG: polysaccharide pyruvyl transferase family protein [Desulfobulbaceae bacterium]|nr:polysaccharide pyruvyl transferase family protein [Desulfobulbaceae bacterium]
MIKLLIPEDFPSQNKGEASLFYGLKESLRPYGNANITLFSLHPEIDRVNYAGEATVIDARGITPAHILDGQGGKFTKTFNYLNFIAKHLLFGVLYTFVGKNAARIMSNPVWQAYSEAELILMSHDSFYTPFYNGTQALLFKLMGKPTVIYAATIKRGEEKANLKTRIIDAWVAFTSKQLTLITLREDLSKAYLTEIGVTEKDLPIKVFPDLAFIVPPVSKDEAWELLRKERVPEGRPLIGMAISQRKLDFAFPGHDIPDRRNRALAPLVELTDFITGELDAVVVFIPHSIGPTQILDDRITADMIREKSRNPEKILIIRNEYSSQQLKGMAACLDMTVGTRLHFTIDAVCSSVPSLLITHDGDLRCHGIIGSMLGMQNYIYNIDSIDADSLIKMAADLWEKRAEVSSHLTGVMDGIKKDTYRHGEEAMALVQNAFSEGRNLP